MPKEPLRNSQSSHKSSHGMSKILQSCAIAKDNKHDYMWVDTVCIDKTSNTELSESINSMFAWYKQASVCYVYLVDVKWKRNEIEQSRSMIRKSRWFTRGWTLQELLAPREMVFFDRSWTEIGTKAFLEQDILSATNIRQVHLHGGFSEASIATKMSWASGRSTSKPEDMAYALIGLFGVTMDLRYGEGRRAFRRLQEILIENSSDESIFAWTKEGVENHGILAAWPDYFADSGSITHRSRKYSARPPYRLTNQGLEWPFPNFFANVQNGADWNNIIASTRRNITIALNCWRKSDEGEGGAGAEEKAPKRFEAVTKHFNTVTIHLHKESNGRWRRQRCDREDLSLFVERSGNPLFGRSNVKLIYIEIE